MENIHDYLAKLCDEVRNGKIKTNDYIIFKVFNIFVPLSLAPMPPNSVLEKTRKTIQMPKISPTFRLLYA